MQTFGELRRTRIEVPAAPMEFREEDYIVDEDTWVIITRDGWIKRQKSFTDVASIRVRDEDRAGWIYRTSSRQTVTFRTSSAPMTKVFGSGVLPVAPATGAAALAPFFLSLLLAAERRDRPKTHRKMQRTAARRRLIVGLIVQQIDGLNLYPFGYRPAMQAP